MTIGKLDRRSTLLLAGAAVLAVLVAFRYTRSDDVVAPTDSIPMAEKRLAKLRQTAATIPGKEAVLKQAQADLGLREKGILIADTAAQAQAQLLDTIRRTAAAEKIDARGAEQISSRPFSADYGEVSVALTFTCRIEQLVNFLSALANDPQMLSTSEMHITSPGNSKEKLITVRLTVSGIVPRKLIPEKKGVSVF